MGLGTFASTAIGTGLRIRRPLRIQTIGLIVVAAAGALATVRFTLPSVMLFCLAVAVSSGLAKLAVDASIQERVPETVRASAFAHAETLLMLAWVAGAAIGLVPLAGRIGVAVAAAGVVAAAVRAARVSRRLRGEILQGRAAPGPPAKRPIRYDLEGHLASPTPAPPVPVPAPTPSGLTSEGRARREDGGQGAPGPARAERAQTNTETDLPPAGFHIFRPSPPDSGVSDPRDGA